jgi:predicted anti-sigma-YlaC factor YlaD
VPLPWVDEHLAGCLDCRNWAEAAAEVTRRARLTVAPPVPDVTAAVLERLPAGRSRRRLPGLDAVLRVALLLVGAGQLAISLPAFAGAGMAGPEHLANETGAWNLALAACFLVVAARPTLAPGSLPFLLPFTAVLAAVTVSDLSAGHVHASRAAAHLLLVGGVLLIGALTLHHRTPRTGPARWRLLVRGASASRRIRTAPADQRARGLAATTVRTHATARSAERAAA